jgi:hypothetical protein
MFDVVRRRITYANTMATVAVLIALGGSSYAAVKVTGRNVEDGSLTGADVRNSSLRSKDIANRSLKSKDIANRSLRAIDFKRGVLRRGRAGEPGVDGADGFDGYDGETGPGVTLASGRIDNIATGGTPATFFGSPTGAGAAATNEAAVQVLSPAEDATASDLSVAFTRYPCDDDLTQNGCGDPGSATVTLRVDGANTPVACTITTPATGCSSGAASADIPAGARLSLEVAGGLDGNTTSLDRDMLFGLAVRPPD